MIDYIGKEILIPEELELLDKIKGQYAILTIHVDTIAHHMSTVEQLKGQIISHTNLAGDSMQIAQKAERIILECKAKLIELFTPQEPKVLEEDPNQLAIVQLGRVE